MWKRIDACIVLLLCIACNGTNRRINQPAETEIPALRFSRITSIANAFGSGVAFSPDGGAILAGSDSGVAQICNVANGKALQKFEWSDKSSERVILCPFGLAYSPRGDLIATSSLQEYPNPLPRSLSDFHNPWPIDRCAIWDVATGTQKAQFQGHSGTILSIDFSPDEKYLLSISTDHTARIWSIETGKETQRFTGHRGGVIAGTYLNDDHVVTADGQGEILIWNPHDGAVTGHFSQSGSFVTGFAASKTGILLATANPAGSIYVWNLDQMKLKSEYPFPGRGIKALAFLSDDLLAMAIDNDPQRATHLETPLATHVSILDLATGKILAETPDFEGLIFHIAVSPNNSQVAFEANRQVMLYSLTRKR